MNWLTKVAKHHKEWVGLIKQWGEHFYAEDLVQEMYLKLNQSTTEEKIVKNGVVNKSYVWFALRSVFIDYQRGKKWEKVSLDNIQLPYEALDVDSESALQKIFIEIDKEIDSWHWYDKKMFLLYINSDKSMRDIEDGTGISLSSIFTTIKGCKTRIANRVGEDYEDYSNQEYERIEKA